MNEPKPSPREANRRRLADRRARPTSIVSLFRRHGRRRGFRRRGEQTNQYVDCPSRRTTILVLSIVLLSLLDALFTLLHLEQGGREINPIMALMLVFGVPIFLIAKTLLTNAGVVFLAIHENFRLGQRALELTAGVYSTLLVYHAALLLQTGR